MPTLSQHLCDITSVAPGSETPAGRYRDGVSNPSDELETVIRVFPDYADSVIWFLGAVPYEGACISRRLAEDLSAWEDRFYAILDDQHWIQDDLREPFDAEGLRLARCLLDELGTPFAVDYVREKGQITRFASTLPGTNLAAVIAFTAMAEELRARSRRFEELLASGVKLQVVQTKHRITH